MWYGKVVVLVVVVVPACFLQEGICHNGEPTDRSA